ncbi:MAG: hypothetical protein K2I68_01515 [Bacteroidales bacterium]|nr:hypothetical protein [Bacteroidales bacterium]
MEKSGHGGVAAYFVHPTAIVDEGCHIGAGTKIWHFSHIMAGCHIGEASSTHLTLPPN